MKRCHLIAPILSTVIIAIYLLFSTLAMLKYPESFSPFSNWLSDLGNRIVSPAGSGYYNTGIILSGAVLAIFFLYSGSIHIKDNKAQYIVLTLSQVFGVIGAIAMIFTGVFSIDIPTKHSFASAVLRICIGTSFGLSVAVLRYFENARKWILIIGGATTLFDLCVSVFFNKVRILEWPVIGLFLIYCFLLGLEIGRLGRFQDS